MAIHKADLTAKRWTIMGLSFILAVSIAAPVFMAQNRQLVDAWIEGMVEIFITLPHLIPLVSFLMIIPLLLLSIYLAMQGQQVCRHQRFPAPSQVVICDTEVREGKTAIIYGRSIQFMALILLICASAFPVLITRIVYTFILPVS